MNTYTQYNVPDAKDRLNLGVGQPSPSILRWNDFQESLKSLNEENNKIMQYGFIPGFLEYRELITNILKDYTGDKFVKPDDIFMTNGISHGAFMLASLLKKECTKVYVQNPTYFIILNMFKDLGYEFGTFDLENLDDLSSKLSKDRNDGKKSLIYLVPFNQNPTGSSITREQILNLTTLLYNYRNDTMLLSDETYQLLNFDTTKNYLSLVTDINLTNIISLGTFSKLIAPALRLGWIYTKNQSILQVLNNCGYMDSGGAVNQIMAKMLCNYLSKHDLKNIINDNMKFLQQNCEKICSILDKYSEYFKYTKPNGGYFVWVECKHFDGKIFQEICSKNNLGFHLGNKFSPYGNFENYFRLSYSYYNAEDYDLMDKRLSDSIKEYLENDLIIINILGGNGRLGKLICEEASKNPELFKINILNREISNIINTHKSIIVDVSTIEGNCNLLAKLISCNYKIPLIIGTTGRLEMELINRYRQIVGIKNVFVCSNFSIGVSSINKYLEDMIPNYWCINMEEHHHVHKKDMPSGTALKFKNILSDNVINKEFDIECKREGEIIGYHKLHLFNEYEEITIIHNAKDRKLFAKGCLEYVKNMVL
jgi:DNA-binding transcriptional MocR family regulator/dihydrodipicolinate reductase